MARVVNVTPDDDWFTGEDKGVGFVIYQGDTDTPEDISGYSLSYMVKRRPKDPDSRAVIHKTNGDGLNVTDGPNGEGELVLDASDIQAIRGGSLYYHELKRTDAGFRTVYIEGTFMLKQAVHR